VYRVLSDKNYLNTFDHCPQSNSYKILSPTQKLPKPALSPFKKNPTMNLIGFVDKPCTQVII